MRIVDSILMELIRKHKRRSESWIEFRRDKLAWKPHPKSFSLASWPSHCVRAGSVAAAAVPDSMEAPTFSQPEPKSRQEVLDTSPRASRVQRTP